MSNNKPEHFTESGEKKFYIEDMTPRDLNRQNQLTARESANSGYTQDESAIRGLAERVDLLSQKAESTTLSRAEQADLDAAKLSLDWQQRAREVQYEEHGQERAAAVAGVPTASKIMRDQLEQSRKTDLDIAVRGLIKERRGAVSEFEALQIIQSAISVDGDVAEAKYLPRFSRIKGRIMSELTDQAGSNAYQAPTPPAAPAAAPRVVDGQNLDEMEAVIRRAHASGADVTDSVALYRHLESKL